mmetsp:Transcript_15544/g.38515  ORF Transcript_15544/g.38515 Transcript_15544/m.38515 type:complete len:91 (-) Transcript_15544:159-431(-)
MRVRSYGLNLMGDGKDGGCERLGDWTPTSSRSAGLRSTEGRRYSYRLIRRFLGAGASAESLPARFFHQMQEHMQEMIRHRSCTDYAGRQG